MEQSLRPEIGKADWLQSCHERPKGNCVMLVIKLKIASWVCSKTLLLRATCMILKSTSRAAWCIFGDRTVVPISWMCKRQTAVSHNNLGRNCLPGCGTANGSCAGMLCRRLTNYQSGRRVTRNHSQSEQPHFMILCHPTSTVPTLVCNCLYLKKVRPSLRRS